MDKTVEQYCKNYLHIDPEVAYPIRSVSDINSFDNADSFIKYQLSKIHLSDGRFKRTLNTIKDYERQYIEKYDSLNKKETLTNLDCNTLTGLYFLLLQITVFINTMESLVQDPNGMKRFVDSIFPQPIKAETTEPITYNNYHSRSTSISDFDAFLRNFFKGEIPPSYFNGDTTTDEDEDE